MKRIFYWLAAITTVGASLVWTFAGGNLGWTKTSDVVKQLDPVTGIEGITYHQAFHPGVDFLGAALVLAAILAAIGFILPRKSLKKAQ